MNQLEKDLRERTQVDSIIGTRVETIEEGKQLMETIATHSKTLLNEMIEGDFDNEQTKAYNDVRYDLKTAKQRIGSQLTKLVKTKIAQR